jgi:hypothetical protein
MLRTAKPPRWEVRVKNSDGAYLDAFGNVSRDRGGSHGIELVNR